MTSTDTHKEARELLDKNLSEIDKHYPGAFTIAALSAISEALAQRDAWKETADAREALITRRTADRDRLCSLLERAKEAVRPFAMAGELFPPRAPEDFDACIYAPAAGEKFNLCGDHLRAASAWLKGCE